MRPILQVIEEELIIKVLREANTVLAEIGIEVRGERLRGELLARGLKQNPDTKRVLFPEDVVSSAIETAPKSIKLYDRDGVEYTELGGNRVHFAPGSSGLKVLDYQTGETRLANTGDFVEYVRLADGLENIALLSTAFSTNNDISAEVADAWRLYLLLTHSKKPFISGAFTEFGIHRMARMLTFFRNGPEDLRKRPPGVFTITATGNFRYSEDSCQNLLDCVEWGIPIEIVPVTLMGLIAPVTLVGALVFHTVDVLAGITMAQVIRPGAPVLFGGAPAAFNMKTASSPMIAVESLRLVTAYTALAKYLELPTQVYNALSEAKFLDAQAGAETYGSALLMALAGVNSVSGPGMLDYLLVFNLQKLVFDNEVCGQVLRFVRETQVVEDLPVLDLVNDQLREEHMLTSEHTMKHWPEEFYLPGEVIDRRNREAWMKMGRLKLEQRTRAEVEKRLAAYTPLETDPRLVTELQHLILAGMPPGSDLPKISMQVKPRAKPGIKRRERRFKRERKG